ncbi:hypothetical protein C8T65DRAFT_195046 [Cerioporus squamosus]|nr:hypothetical protein C8T65DRAFT_195046 [Cerioporus squamosus]
MRFTITFTALASAVVVPQVAASPTPVGSLVTTDEFLKWLDTTDAEITYIGKPINGSVPRAVRDVMVTYCNKRTQNVCGGTCTVYNGPATRLAATAHDVPCGHGQRWLLRPRRVQRELQPAREMRDAA